MDLRFPDRVISGVLNDVWGEGDSPMLTPPDKKEREEHGGMDEKI